jgi:hypothetical protein
MTKEQSRQLGQVLMGFAVVQLLLFLLGASKKSYAALALPVFCGLSLASALAFWVGWTMAANRWDEDDPE